MQIGPYLFFAGQCEEAFRFYEATLGGRIEGMMTFAEGPEPDAVEPGERGWIMHAGLVLGDQLLMGSDAPSPHFERPQGFAVSLSLDGPSEVERVFAALSAGGEVRMPLEETFFAARFGMCVDRFGTPWMISCDPPAEARS